MEKVKVTCPNCGKDFDVDVNATRGKCPYCKISLIFENVEEKPQSSPQAEVQRRRKRGILEEKVDISYIENVVDSLSEQPAYGAKDISDIAVIELLEEESNEPDIEKKVDRIIRAKE